MASPSWEQEMRLLKAVILDIDVCTALIRHTDLSYRDKTLAWTFLQKCTREVQSSLSHPLRADLYTQLAGELLPCRRWLFQHIGTAKLPSTRLVLPFSQHGDDTLELETAIEGKAKSNGNTVSHSQAHNG